MTQGKTPADELIEYLKDQIAKVYEERAPLINRMSNRERTVALMWPEDDIAPITEMIMAIWKAQHGYGDMPLVHVGELTEKAKAERSSPPITLIFGTEGEG